MDKNNYYNTLINDENFFTNNAGNDYGEYFYHAKDVIELFFEFINDEGFHPNAATFVRFFSQVRNFAVLALLSFVRRHEVQGFMDIRQMNEASVLAVYALNNNNESDFYSRDENGAAFIKNTTKEKANKFLEENFKDYSDIFKRDKKKINELFSHANIISSVANANPTPEGIEVSFFDYEGKGLEKITEYWLFILANRCLGILRMFEQSDKDNFLRIPKTINRKIRSYFEENKKLEKQIKKIINSQRT